MYVLKKYDHPFTSLANFNDIDMYFEPAIYTKAARVKDSVTFQLTFLFWMDKFKNLGASCSVTLIKI